MCMDSLYVFIFQISSQTLSHSSDQETEWLNNLNPNDKPYDCDPIYVLLNSQPFRGARMP